LAKARAGLGTKLDAGEFTAGARESPGPAPTRIHAGKEGRLSCRRPVVGEAGVEEVHIAGDRGAGRRG
jgi:hypothetical protein